MSGESPRRFIHYQNNIREDTNNLDKKRKRKLKFPNLPNIEIPQPRILDKNKLNLSNVTLIIVDCVDIDRCVIPINKSIENIAFNDVVLITSIRKHIDINANVKYIDKLNNTNDYSKFIIKNLTNYVNTDFVLIIQWDGYVVNYNKWTDKFLKYDYIGAPIKSGKSAIVGNGGFSLRSKKLLEFCKLHGDYMINHSLKSTKKLNEDIVLIQHHKRYLSNHHFVIAPLKLAQQFSSEYTDYNGEFGWHGARKLWKEYHVPGIVMRTNPYIKHKVQSGK